MPESVKSQGTGLYFAAGDPVSVMKLTCPTGITGIGAGQRSQINDTGLDELEEESFVSGLASPGAMSVPFIFKPTEADQQSLFDLKASGAKISWIVGFSDGTAAPTLDSNDVLVGAAARTSAAFTAYVSEVTIDAASNDVVKGTLSLQRSGAVIWNWKA